MNNILVTIGIPCYNVEKFIAASINSVLRQTYQNFELIITDDGSIDGTLDVINKFKDKRIILVADGENHGISYRLNQQINMARGEYFIRMDGDDIMFPDRVEKQVKFLEKNHQIDVIGSNAVIIDDKNKIIGCRDCSNKESFDAEKAIISCPFIHPTVAGRMVFFKKYLYDETLCGVEDKDLWFRGLIGGSKYQILDKPLMFYRDPLQFKLSTYLFRLKMCRKQIITRWNLITNKAAALRFVMATYVKELMAILVVMFSVDDKIIGRRNVPISNKKKFENVLKSQI